MCNLHKFLVHLPSTRGPGVTENIHSKKEVISCEEATSISEVSYFRSKDDKIILTDTESVFYTPLCQA